LSNVDCRGDCSLVIYDIFGREVMKTSIILQTSTLSINISSLRSGLYIASCRDKHKRLFVGKFIKY